MNDFPHASNRDDNNAACICYPGEIGKLRRASCPAHGCSAANLPELRCVDPTRHETHEWEDGWTRYRCPGSPDARSAATKLDDALADVESYIVNGGYETIFDGKERHAVLMDRRKALAALSDIKNVLRKDGHRV